VYEHFKAESGEQLTSALAGANRREGGRRARSALLNYAKWFALAHAKKLISRCFTLRLLPLIECR
jgi:hypothetical protein